MDFFLVHMMAQLEYLNEPVKHVASNVSDKEAFEDIIQTLKRQSEKVTLLFTGHSILQNHHAQVLQHFLLVKRYHPSKLTFLYTER
jgi:nitrate reductase alpha subunit